MARCYLGLPRRSRVESGLRLAKEQAILVLLYTLFSVSICNRVIPFPVKEGLMERVEI